MNIPDDVIASAVAATDLLDPPYTEDLTEAVQVAGRVIAEWVRKEARLHALLDANALCTTTTDATAISRLIEAERQEKDDDVPLRT